MNRKVMAVAVAAAFAAPAAFAQSTVTIGGTINISWDNIRANGATLQGVAGAPDSNNIKSHDRVRDGAGSNIRFFVGEDLGGGNQAFVQVESAIIQNSDTRTTNFGTVQGIGATGGNSTAIWGNRNTAIGIRSKSLGRFLIGVWDMHYDEMGAIDPMPSLANSSNSYLGLMQNLGSALSVSPGAGTRYANVIRWDSPVWSGFNMTVSYARPADGVPVNHNPGGGASILDGKKNRAWHIAARYDTGGLAVRYSYLNDKDAGTAVTLTFGGGATSGIGANSVSTVAGGAGVTTSVWKVTSNRLGARYRFANGFGLGLIWDSSKFSADHQLTGTVTAAAGTSIKRTAWAIPLTFETGNHVFAGTYARAKDWRGTLNGVSVSNWGYLSTADTFGTNLAGAINAAGLSNTLSGDTGAKLWTLSYQYKLSQRTSVHASWTSLKNEALARYDFFANSSGAGAANVGADPRSIALGMRHTF